MFELNEDQQSLVAMVRDFANEALAPNAAKWDETKHFPVDVLREAGALGIGGVYVQEEYRRLRTDPQRCGADLRGTGQGRSDDCRLHLHPQHGGLDDRLVRQRRAARRSGYRNLPPWKRWAATA